MWLVAAYLNLPAGGIGGCQRLVSLLLDAEHDITLTVVNWGSLGLMWFGFLDRLMVLRDC
jgi:hypothetical protein